MQQTKGRKRSALKECNCQSTDDFQALCYKLQNWDKGEKFVASDLAREFQISGTDAGHKIKLLTLELGADIEGLELTSKSRRSLKKYQNSDVSMPAPPNGNKRFEFKKLVGHIRPWKLESLGNRRY